MKSFYSLILLLVLSSSIFTQNKLFTIEDVVVNSYTTLASEKLPQLSWIPKSHFVSYVKDNTLVKVNSATGEKVNLFNLDELNSHILSNNLGKELKKSPKLNWIDTETVSFWKDSNLVVTNTNFIKLEIKNSISSLAKNKVNSPNNDFIAFTVENNLFVSTGLNEINQITNEKDIGIISGQTVSRNEFGIKGGIFWSPKSNYLAFYQKDEREVTNYPLVEIGSAPAKLKNTKYPMAGQISETVKIGIYDLQNDKTVWLATDGPKDQYLTNVTWDPSEKYIYVAHLNRDQNHLKLVKYDAHTGNKVNVLFEEKDDEYVEPEFPLQFICKDENKFVWFSERDGWQHLYLYDTDGKLIKQITKGEWIVKKIVGSDKNSNEIYFIGTKDTPIEDHLYKVNVKSEEVDRISIPNKSHTIKYNNHNNTFLDTYTCIGTPSVIQIIDNNGKMISEINRSENSIAEYALSEPKIFTLKGENNIDLYSRLILPTDFDSTKSYPVIVYVYGGPHDQLVTNIWYTGKYDFWFQYMAQRGFIVFTLDNRGSAGRGLEFEQAIFGRLGTKEIEDQLVGVEYLKTLSYVDSNRIGVYGWSYGGFMTTALMLRTNDTYKVGVGGGAVIDWKLYEIMYGERYMDTPQTNPDGYKEANLLNYVANLNGKLLLVHGTSDPTVVWENTLEFAKKAANLNKPLDYFPYVGHGHGVKGKDAVHLYEKISNYFIENL